MSIEMDNPATLLEKADAAANLVEQMFLAHQMKDEARFKTAHQKASLLLSDVVLELDERKSEQDEDEWQNSGKDKLFKFFAEEHNLVFTDTELNDIIHAVKTLVEA